MNECLPVSLQTEPRIERDLPESQYHLIDAMSASRLRILDKGTTLHLAASLASPPSSPSLVVGRALHCLSLTPESFARSFVVAPSGDRRTTAGKAAYESFVSTVGDRTILTDAQYGEVIAMRNMIDRHPDAHAFVRRLDGVAEVSLFADIAGIQSKARLDRVVEINGERVIVDIKTTASGASKDVFERTIWQYGYGLQCAFYLEMARICGVPAQHFVFVVVEKSAPYAVAVYRFSDEIASHFRPRLLELIEEYRSFLKDGPRGYEGITEIGIPSWAAAKIAPNLGEFTNED
jgi:exodeoxyribonuclease VIII